jgi:hypothetical protein
MTSGKCYDEVCRRPQVEILDGSKFCSIFSNYSSTKHNPLKHAQLCLKLQSYHTFQCHRRKLSCLHNQDPVLEEISLIWPRMAPQSLRTQLNPESSSRCLGLMRLPPQVIQTISAVPISPKLPQMLATFQEYDPSLNRYAVVLTAR